MQVLSVSDVEEFCKLCDWAHEVWLNHLELFDNNKRESELMNSFAAEELERLCIISQEYSLLQIAKLHDRAIMNGSFTLGINYVLRHGGWSDSIRYRLEELAKKLNDFAFKLRNVRNKLLSHNDRATFRAAATLGEFAEGDDLKYFRNLQEFVNIVHDEVVGGIYPFNTQAINDVAAFLATIKP